MKKIIKDSLRVLGDYCISLVIFVIFLYIFFAITKDNYSKWIPLYSVVIFTMLAPMIYSDMRNLAIKEKRPQYNLKPYPLRGLVLGFVGFMPIIVVEIIYLFLNFNNSLLDRIKDLVLKTILGPVYFSVRLAGGTVIAYIIASLVVPVVAMLGYLAGYYGIELRRKNHEEKSIKK